MSEVSLPIVAFDDILSWTRWLEKNHTNTSGIWIQFFKKTTKITSINHDEALDEALCYGWIDGQAKPYDEKSWLQKFTPRRKRSMWSKINRERVARLIQIGKMKEAGFKEVEKAKIDGRWDAAYDSPSNMTVPEDFLKELSKDKKAKDFFDSLNKTNTYAIVWRLQTAKKPETRERRMKIILEMLAKEEKFH
ncbi:MAG: YdeI/OmpD-associated family protein [Patescibacteria group bacterium]